MNLLNIKHLCDTVEAYADKFPFPDYIKATVSVVRKEITPKTVPDLDAKDEIFKFFDGVTAVVEANSFEYSCLWEKYNTEGWDENYSGRGITVGYLDENPIFIGLRKAKIRGADILFVDATSRVVDWEIIRAWLEHNLPTDCLKENGCLKYTDANNFHNALPRKPREEVTNNVYQS
jgi:hypothetical protein